MVPPADNSVQLSVNRVFVVQFQSDTAVKPGPLTGQPGHVVSGQAADFVDVI
jgi:hypothetical protein